MSEQFLVRSSLIPSTRRIFRSITPSWRKKLTLRELLALPLSPDLSAERRDSNASFASTLILVPCHGAFQENIAKVPLHPVADKNWKLLRWQIGEKEPIRYMEHFATATQQFLQKDYRNDSILLLSGSYRNRNWSEALTYFGVGKYYDWFLDNGEKDYMADIEKNIWTDFYALSSFMNLLGGICSFRKITGRYPKKIVITGWKFKRYRFEVLHRKALRIPEGMLEYIGVNNPSDAKEAEEGEMKRGIIPSSEDIYGTGDALSEKLIKEGRNVLGLYDPMHGNYGVFVKYAEWAPELRPFIEHIKKPENKNIKSDNFSGRFPWD